MADIVLDNVSKKYPDGFEAVKDLNLEIADGEFVILVGPSGCGKSTALRMVAGLEDITGGELRIGGEVVNQKAPKDRDIAMVFQNYALYPHMTVGENMGFALKLAKTDKAEIDKKVNEAAKILDLDQHLSRKPANLSGGQRQRVAMGRAIVRNPAAFLMDEPLSNLDAKLRVQMRTEVSRIQQNLGTTTVYVTHDQTEAMTLGDRVAVMRAGVLQQVGSPMELYNDPKNLFVAGFIGSPAMNFMPATVEGDRVKLPMADVALPQAARERVGRGRRRPADRGDPPRELRGRLAGGHRAHGPGHPVQGHHRPGGVHGRRAVRALQGDLGRRAGVRPAARAGRGLGRRRGAQQRRGGPDRGPPEPREQGPARARSSSCGWTPATSTCSTPPRAISLTSELSEVCAKRISGQSVPDLAQSEETDRTTGTARTASCWWSAAWAPRGRPQPVRCPHCQLLIGQGRGLAEPSSEPGAKGTAAGVFSRQAKRAGAGEDAASPEEVLAAIRAVAETRGERPDRLLMVDYQQEAAVDPDLPPLPDVFEAFGSWKAARRKAADGAG